MLRIFPVAIVLSVAALPPERAASPSRDLPRAEFNENRVPAGRMSRGTLTVSLEIREATWHLLGDDQPAASILAFAEKGKTPQMPGPLLRVPMGTRLEISIATPTIPPSWCTVSRPGARR